jgi:hypothetical protein
MWNMKCVTPANARATGIVTEGLKKYVTRKAFNRFSKKKQLSGGVHHWFKRGSTRGK